MSTRTGRAEDADCAEGAAAPRAVRAVAGHPANVVLVGLSGSGKTTVGRVLARHLGWRLLDTDQEIRRRTGKAIEQIFREDGEPHFRAIEAKIVQAACAGARQVIATGGGAVLDPDNRRRMRDGNLVVLLETSPETLAARLQNSLARHPRPLLAGPDLVARLAELARQREPQYRCAHHVVQTDGRGPNEVAEAIARLVRARE